MGNVTPTLEQAFTGLSTPTCADTAELTKPRAMSVGLPITDVDAISNFIETPKTTLRQFLHKSFTAPPFRGPLSEKGADLNLPSGPRLGRKASEPDADTVEYVRAHLFIID